MSNLQITKQRTFKDSPLRKRKKRAESIDETGIVLTNKAIQILGQFIAILAECEFVSDSKLIFTKILHFIKLVQTSYLQPKNESLRYEFITLLNMFLIHLHKIDFLIDNYRLCIKISDIILRMGANLQTYSKQDNLPLNSYYCYHLLELNKLFRLRAFKNITYMKLIDRKLQNYSIQNKRKQIDFSGNVYSNLPEELREYILQYLNFSFGLNII